jgi:hypothetical protein
MSPQTKTHKNDRRAGSMPAKQLKRTATTMKNQNNNPSELDQLMAAALSVVEAQMRRFGFTIISYNGGHAQRHSCGARRPKRREIQLPRLFASTVNGLQLGLRETDATAGMSIQ